MSGSKLCLIAPAFAGLAILTSSVSPALSGQSSFQRQVAPTFASIYADAKDRPSVSLRSAQVKIASVNGSVVTATRDFDLDRLKSADFGDETAPSGISR